VCRTFLLPGASGQLLKRRVSYRKATAAQAPIFVLVLTTCDMRAVRRPGAASRRTRAGHPGRVQQASSPPIKTPTGQGADPFGAHHTVPVRPTRAAGALPTVPSRRTTARRYRERTSHEWV